MRTATMEAPAETTRGRARSEVALGIVCPMANESDSAERFVREVLAECQGFRSVTMFVVLDNVSKDGTRAILENLSRDEHRLQVVWAPENRSVVDAYMRGYRAALDAECDWILEIDAGFSHQPADIPQYFDKMEQGYDCVFGSRFSKGSKVTDNSLKRLIVSYGGTMLINFLLNSKLRDMTSGFEMFTRQALQRALDRGVHSRGPFFQTEIKMHCHDLRMAEVPIHYRAASHNVNQSVINDAFSNLWRLFRERRARSV